VIYLASPYSCDSSWLRCHRYRQVCKATAWLMRQGHFVFSPIVNSHPLVEFGLPEGWDYWENLDRIMIGHCDKLIVLKISGWKSSVGVRAEIHIADETGKPVVYLNPEEISNVG